MFPEFLILFVSVYFWGSSVGLSSFLGHCGAVIIALSSLKNLSRTYLFWLVILITILTAQELRFSLEYVLFAMGFFGVALSKNWNGFSTTDKNKRKKILCCIFLLLILTNHYRLDLSERGSLLMWLPIFLVLYFEKIDKNNFLVYLASGCILLFSNKLTTFLAFIISLRSKYLYVLSTLILSGYFVYKESLTSFLLKSFEPRLYIWKSVWNGFLEKPFFGHGFGTFALDFPVFRTHSEVLGGRISEQIVHGHSLFSHYAFELGLFGLILIGVVFYLIYINVPRAFLPLLVISLCDSPLVTFNQFLLCGLLIVSFIRNFGIFKTSIKTFPNKYIQKASFVLGILLYCSVFIPSLVGHYYYVKNIDMAIKWDNKNSLYYFTRGANNLNKDTIKSERDFVKAIELSPSISYFYGFLGAAQLANNKFSEAKKTLEKSMKLDGGDGYWCLLYAYANYKDEKVFKKYKVKALKRNPEIKEILSNPNITTARYIGATKHGDIRLAGFYRTGDKIFFPLPIIR